jgi:hypothetical protein
VPSGAAGGPAGAAGAIAGGGAMQSAGARLPPASSLTADGPFTPMVEQGVDGGDGWLFRPSELGMEGIKHPVLVWGTGSTSVPSNYMLQLSRIASHGFVVYSPDTPMVDGARLKKGLDWVFAENERDGGELHQKLDLTNVAVGGHSLGSLSTFEILDDARITNTIHMDGGTFDGMGPEKLEKPAIFICGEDTIAKDNCDRDFELAVNAPVFYTKIAGLSGLQGHIQAANEGLEIWIAWMRWTLAGEEQRRADFLEPMGTYRTGKYDSQVKGW